MRYWIKKFASIIAWSTFLVIFFCGIDTDDLLNERNLMISLVKSLIGASLIWFAAFIAADILLKGVLEDIPEDNIDHLDGGILQRISESKKSVQVTNRIENKGSIEEKENKSK
jgi:hypothetical protein